MSVPARAFALDRGIDMLRAVRALERVGQRQRENAARRLHALCLNGRDQARNQRRRQAGARGVVHEHPVAILRTETPQRRQAMHDGRVARIAAAVHLHQPGRVETAAWKPLHERLCTGCSDDQHRIDFSAREERLRGMPQHRPPTDRLILLWQIAPGTRAGTRGWNQRKTASARAGSRHEGRRNGTWAQDLRRFGPVQARGWRGFYNSGQRHDTPPAHAGGVSCFVLRS